MVGLAMVLDPPANDRVRIEHVPIRCSSTIAVVLFLPAVIARGRAGGVLSFGETTFRLHASFALLV